MNWIDLVLVVNILLSVISGFTKGFVIGFLNLITWLGSVLIGFFFYIHVAAFIESFTTAMGVWTRPVAFIGTVIFARIIISLITDRLLHLTPERTHGDSFNKFLGIFPGFVNGVINAIIIAALLLSLPLSEAISNTARESKLANYFVAPAEWLEAQIAPVFGDAVQRSMNRLMVKPESDETVKLHYTVANPKVREDLEAKMLELVNAERAKAGLKPLAAGI